MGKIIEAGNLPESDKVYLKKDVFGYRVVHPIKDQQTNKLIWFNLLVGGKRGLFILIFLLLLGGLFYMGINDLIGNYKQIAESPCDFCTSCHEQTQKILNIYGSKNKIDFSGLNLSEVIKNVSSR